jgi:hypothetical protein
VVPELFSESQVAFGTIFRITSGFRNYFRVISGYLKAVTTLPKRVSVRVFRIRTYVLS